MSRKFWLLAGTILGVLVIAGMFRLRFDTDVLNLLPGDMPVVQGLQLYQRHFTDSRELILTLRAPDGTVAEAAAKSLAEQLRADTNLVSSVIWEPAWLERPVQAAELIAYLWLNQPPNEVRALTNRLGGTNIAASLEEARDQLTTSFSPMDLIRRANDPYDLMNLPANVSGGAAVFGQGQNLFASPDGTFRIMFVRATPDISNYRDCIVWIKQMHATIERMRASGDIAKEVSIGFTGGPAFTAEISSGMQHDMTASIGITSAIIAVLFWIFHRRLLPMAWLLILLGVILICTLGLGGLFFGSVNVVSLGFAGILLGLAVDYGVVHYQEALASPNAIIPEIRRAVGPGIFWAAVTTISAFLALNFGGIPGLAQLGSLVALGVMLSALVMLFAFLPPLFRDRIKRRRELVASNPSTLNPVIEEEAPEIVSRTRLWGAVAATAFLMAVALVILSFGIPLMDHSADALRPQKSPAYAALDDMKRNLTQGRDPLWLITRATNEMQIALRLNAITPVLDGAVSNHLIETFTLPTPLWPQPDNQAANRTALASLLAERQELRDQALQAGFTTNSLVMLDNIFNVWETARSKPGVFWPTNEMSQWIMDKIAARSGNEFLAVGFIFPNKNRAGTSSPAAELSAEVSQQGFILSGWDLLGSSLLDRVQQNLWKMLVPMVGLVLLSLWLAFRRLPEIALSIAVLCLSGLCLLAVMRLAGWSWNLLNLMALPLMLGSGVDYSIFMQLALKRHHGNMHAAHRAVGRALLLCGGTAVAGFGSLALSTNAGMASLGAVCAIGIGFNMLISVLMLPAWWRMTIGRTSESEPQKTPSTLYRSDLWRLGLWTAKSLPPKISAAAAKSLADIYWQFAGHRREIVIENLMPALNNDRPAAERMGRKLMEQFALKIMDLWRYESGLPVEHLFAEWTGWEHFAQAQAQKRGILLVTPHLGNWEFGGPLLTKRGVNLQVITLAEPGNGFTELRQASRARWNIDTLVIGEDPFAFVEVIRRLEAGATVALLIDRPPAASRVTVELFGRPFDASIAAAELARASGCVVLPVYLPHTANGYAAHVLPMVDYDRAGLRQRDARRDLTQRILSSFEKPIRQYLDQWYHFVPVWPNNPTEKRP